MENFPLFVDQLEELKVDTGVLAAEMALTLATAHWIAGNDLDDAEFVLGSSPRGRVLTPWRRDEDIQRLGAHEGIFDWMTRGTCLWLTDFDKTKKVDRSVAGMRRAARAAETNDPYFPKPPSTCKVSTKKDDKLWEIFSAKYLEASETILKAEFGSALALDEGPGGLLAWVGIKRKSDLRRKVEEVLDLPRVFLEEWKCLRTERVARGWLY